VGPKADQRGLQLLELSAEGRELTELPRRGWDCGGARDRGNDARYQLARDRLAVRHRKSAHTEKINPFWMGVFCIILIGLVEGPLASSF
jgi:hypothetical protein